VGELAAHLPVSRPAVSQHLKVLKAAGLVSDTQVGTRRLYGLDPEGVATVRAYFDRFWDDVLADFVSRADGASKHTTRKGGPTWSRPPRSNPSAGRSR
jgi:DNA-binding transcriptional ArsR family regulator